MRIKILPECKSDMWYSELAGMELPCLGQDEDVYWSREPGFPFAKNIILKGDAVLVDGATIKLLHLDIETAPMVSHHWDARTDYIPHDFNIQPTTILCASWKLGNRKVENTSIHEFHKRLTESSVRKDKQVVKKIHQLLMEAAEENYIVVYQNGDRFDLPKIKSRCIAHGLPPIPRLTTIDTLKKARKLGFDYKRLDYLDKYLHGHQAGKVETRGWLMWRDIVSPHSNHEKRLKAIKEMVHYCDGDILALERVFNTLRPHMDTFPTASANLENQPHPNGPTT